MCGVSMAIAEEVLSRDSTGERTQAEPFVTVLDNRVSDSDQDGHCTPRGRVERCQILTTGTQGGGGKTTVHESIRSFYKQIVCKYMQCHVSALHVTA